MEKPTIQFHVLVLNVNVAWFDVGLRLLTIFSKLWGLHAAIPSVPKESLTYWMFCFSPQRTYRAGNERRVSEGEGVQRRKGHFRTRLSVCLLASPAERSPSLAAWPSPRRSRVCLPDGEIQARASDVTGDERRRGQRGGLGDRGWERPHWGNIGGAGENSSNWRRIASPTVLSLIKISVTSVEAQSRLELKPNCGVFTSNILSKKVFQMLRDNILFCNHKVMTPNLFSTAFWTWFSHIQPEFYWWTCF